MRDPNSVDGAIAGNALAVSALVGTRTCTTGIWSTLKTAKTPEEYYNYFRALPSFQVRI